jgi:hypothetical protein
MFCINTTIRSKQTVAIRFERKIYKENKAKVLNFSTKDFDRVFFKFSEKKSLEINLILTKQAFYKYTIQIAAFFRSIGVLYPDQKING